MQKKYRIEIIAIYLILLIYGISVVFRWGFVDQLYQSQLDRQLTAVYAQHGDGQKLYETTADWLGVKSGDIKQRVAISGLEKLSAYNTLNQITSDLLEANNHNISKENRIILLTARGTSSLSIKRYKEGLTDLENAWRLGHDVRGNASLLQNNLAYALVLNNTDWDRAEDLAASSYNADNNPAAADTLGWIEVHQGSFGNGLQYILEAVDSNPDSYDCRYHSGVAYWALGNYAKAESELQLAMKLYKTQRKTDNADFKAILELVTAKAPYQPELVFTPQQ